MHELHGIVALELGKRSRVTIDADVAQRRRFALHDRTAAEMRFKLGVVGRHHGNQRLTQPRGRLGTEISHLPRSRSLCGSHTIAMRPYEVKNKDATACRHRLG